MFVTHVQCKYLTIFCPALTMVNYMLLFGNAHSNSKLFERNQYLYNVQYE